MKKWIITLIILITLVLLMIAGASAYFFYVAQFRSEKDFINNKARTPESSLYQDEQAFNQLPKEKRYLTNQGLKQVAWYVPAEKKSDKTVIVVHGFTNDKLDMKPYAYMFHQLGYNVLMPDNVAHGESQGRIIGYGWNDKDNVIKWANNLIAGKPKQKITLFGVSMGAATVMMASGEKLPKQVTTIIEDCGYTSVWEELSYQARDMYDLKPFPILYGVSGISKLLAGFTYGQASSVKQLAKNDLPVLFIHGDADKFVLTDMVYDNFKASQGPKELYIAKGAKHAQSFEKNPETYRRKIEDFLKKYQK
ncbi:alpha/beta hydrolase [Streptococcus sp. ZJ151]|uniref:alpha/beta hydrolase n=1 Tax=Streptococcus jiangjianxini TaxID=3161189 RepID=UPI0032EC81B5